MFLKVCGLGFPRFIRGGRENPMKMTTHCQVLNWVLDRLVWGGIRTWRGDTRRHFERRGGSRRARRRRVNFRDTRQLLDVEVEVCLLLLADEEAPRPLDAANQIEPGVSAISLQGSF